MWKQGSTSLLTSNVENLGPDDVTGVRKSSRVVQGCWGSSESPAGTESWLQPRLSRGRCAEWDFQPCSPLLFFLFFFFFCACSQSAACIWMSQSERRKLTHSAVRDKKKNNNNKEEIPWRIKSYTTNRGFCLYRWSILEIGADLCTWVESQFDFVQSEMSKNHDMVTLRSTCVLGRLFLCDVLSLINVPKPQVTSSNSLFWRQTIYTFLHPMIDIIKCKLLPFEELESVTFSHKKTPLIKVFNHKVQSGDVKMQTNICVSFWPLAILQ